MTRLTIENLKKAAKARGPVPFVARCCSACGSPLTFEFELAKAIYKDPSL